jgi:hypothetical protein
VLQVSDAKEVTNAKQHVARGIKVTRKYFQVNLVVDGWPHHHHTDSLDDLQDCLDCLRGAVTIAFPEGLPDYDDVRQVIQPTFRFS